MGFQLPTSVSTVALQTPDLLGAPSCALRSDTLEQGSDEGPTQKRTPSLFVVKTESWNITKFMKNIYIYICMYNNVICIIYVLNIDIQCIYINTLCIY